MLGLGLALLALTVACGFWVVKVRHPQIVLPDGTRISYFGHSRGVPMGPYNFRHSGPPAEEHSPVWLHRLRSVLPSVVTSYLPGPTVHRTGYPAWPDSHEFELQFRTEGDLSQHLWDICVADEQGWETRVRDYTWSDAKTGAAPVTGWLRLGSAYPRGSKTIRIVFHPSDRQKPKPDRATRLKPAAELIVPNPFWQAPASTPAESLPVSLPFRGATLTLQELQRDRIVGDDYGALRALLVIERDGKAVPGFQVVTMEVSDSSGQVFRQTSSGYSESLGRMRRSTDTAPWSDDPCWVLRFGLCRKDRFLDVPETELFKFYDLPLPSEAPADFEREVTCQGVTLRLGKFTRASDGPRFVITGWVNNTTGKRRYILVEAKDDQGRSEMNHPRLGRRPIVGGPVGVSRDGVTYSLNLPAEAKSWNLTLLAETVTEVECRVRSPLVAPRVE
jgi:hypothetical protein